MKIILALLAMAMAMTADIALADPTAEEKAEIDRLTKLRDSLKPQLGVIRLPSAKASLNLGDKYYFLGEDDARRVLEEGWGNPTGSAQGVLGLIMPKGQTFLDDTWGAVVTYEPTDYVTDDDAKTADYAQLLKDIQTAADEANPERIKKGFPEVHVIGWAQPPRYDAGRHDLIWARDIQFGADAAIDHTLNYDVRHLGRNGVLSMNMVSTMSQLPQVKAAATQLAATAEFDSGSRYADYQAGDKKAGYGLAGLVAAGVGVGLAQKAGVLAIVLAFLKKGLVFIAAGGAAVAAWARRTFGKKSE